jgi:tetratricopeptide (TPR) repeat protein
MLVLRCGEVDLDRRVVCRDGQTLDLTPHEVATLRYLHARAGRVVERGELLREVWGYAPGSRSQAVHVAIRRGGGRPERHVALEASIDASWQLLDPAAQRGLADLTAFEAAFPVSAAEAVLGDGALNVLQSLLDASVIRRVGERIDPYPSVRAFVQARAPASPEALARHGAWFAARDPNRVGADDIADTIAAIERALDRDDADTATRCAHGLGTAARKHLVPGVIALLDRVLAVTDGDGRVRLLRARAMNQGRTDTAGALRTLAGLEPEDPLQLGLTREMRALFLLRQGDLDGAERELGGAREAFRRAARPHNEVTVRMALADVAGRRGRRTEARALIAEALDRARDLGDLRLQAGALGNLAAFARSREEAVGLTRDAIALMDRIGDQYGGGTYRLNLAYMQLDAGALDEAEALTSRAGEQLAGLDRRGETHARALRGAIARARGALDEARGWLLEAVGAADRFGDRRLGAVARRHLAGVLRAEGEEERALALFDEAVSALEALEEPVELARTVAERDG